MASNAADHVIRWNDGTSTEALEHLAVEEPLEIRVRGRAITITMRTPGHDSDLATGFLLTEGIVRCSADILQMQPCTQISEDGTENNVLNVILAPEVQVDFLRLTRHVFAASSCGICGKASIDAIRAKFPRIDSPVQIPAAQLLTLPGKMRLAQHAFETTGGIHAAGLFDRHGNALIVHEDIGRHNAVDKVIGHMLLNNKSADVLMVSGRTSFEILQKALAARIPIIAAVSAPSSLAVDFAREMGQTLIGFLREKRMNIYSHSQRVQT